ncbi:MAG TPA: hypothetical protein VFE68_02405 [Vicinamibacteria bacterium]|nr:hypothetical protein [Vicinamibacteria bacterium]
MTRADEIEARRILARYKRLILLGKARLPLEQARRIVGPDCAYHLYGRGREPPRRRRRRSAGARRR